MTGPHLRIDDFPTRVMVRTGSQAASLTWRDSATRRTLLTRFVHTLQNARPSSLGTPSAASLQFLSLSKRRTSELLGESVQDLYKSVEIFRRIIFSQLASAKVAGLPLECEIVSYSEDYFPWELFGVPDADSDVVSAAETQLGLAAVISRKLAGSVGPNGSQILNGNRLTVRFFKHLTLPGSDKELQHFRRQCASTVDLRGPLPAHGEDGAPDLASHLVDPAFSSRIDGTSPDQILHISCHHGLDRRSNRLLAETSLFFGEDKCEVNVPQLGREVDTLSRVAENDSRPVVFVNACSGDFHPYATESLARILVRNSNPLVISTSMAVPDSVAAEFSNGFYRRLLSVPRMSVGRTMCVAKRDLLERGSPLGVLYTSYGDIDMQVVAEPKEM